MASPLISPQAVITPKQLQVLQQIGTFQQNQCYLATIGELAQTLNVSRATAYEHIAALREKKLLAQSTGKARCLKLTDRGEKLLEQSVQFERNSETPALEGIYLRGRVSAGYGIDAIEESQPFSLGEVFGNRGDVFALRVCGKSMTGAGINDGDYVICKHAATADNGQLVIVLLDNGENATLKRFFKDAAVVRLQPENDAFEPILSRNCQIQAVVVGVVRHF
ncbi:MAG: repressor LexA [Phycisphaerae bacterium]|nr:repressor LexA [Phycisphaerae bacterium]